MPPFPIALDGISEFKLLIISHPSSLDAHAHDRRTFLPHFPIHSNRKKYGIRLSHDAVVRYTVTSPIDLPYQALSECLFAVTTLSHPIRDNLDRWP